MAPLGIVYFAYLAPGRPWEVIIRSQVQDIAACGILQQSEHPCKLYIVLTDEHGLAPQAIELINQTLKSNNVNMSHVFYDITHNNHFEYPGLKKVHTIACSEPQGFYAYIHSKGMVFHTRQERDTHEQPNTKALTREWGKVINVFETMPHINKIGLFPASGGWIWFNFFWARGTYLQQCKAPIIDTNRYFYEDWLGKCGSGTWEDSYSLFSSTSTHFQPHEACSAAVTIKN